jgi:hypothetical protein|tara:strand:+ start:501 stop:632 length:132 start_codon:yes stop_codon:yes gene_type:complete
MIWKMFLIFDSVLAIAALVVVFFAAQELVSQLFEVSFYFLGAV